MPPSVERRGDRLDDPGGDRPHRRRLIEVFAQDHELVAREAGQGVAGTKGERQPVGDGHQQLVAGAVPVQIVHELEPVEIGEEHRGPLARSPGSTDRVIQSFEEEDPIGQPGERVVQRALTGSVEGVSEVDARLCVEQVGGRDVGQRLGGIHRVRVQHARCVSVQVERSQPRAAITQREGEHRTQPLLECPRCEVREPLVVAEVWDRDGPARSVRDQARPLPELRLQLLEPHRCSVRRRDVAGIELRGDERDAGGRDRQDVDDAPHEVIEDGLDGEVRDQRVGELTQHVRELLLAWHDHPLARREGSEAAGSGRRTPIDSRPS